MTLMDQAREERSYYIQKAATAKPSEAAMDAAQPNTGSDLCTYQCPQCGFRADLPPNVESPVCPDCRVLCLKSGKEA